MLISVLSFSALLVPVSAKPDSYNLDYADHVLWNYEIGDLSDIAVIDCPEAAGFSYGTVVQSSDGYIYFYGYAYEDESVDFHVTFKNIGTNTYTLDFSLGYYDTYNLGSVNPDTLTLDPGEVGTVTFTLDSTGCTYSESNDWYESYYYNDFDVDIDEYYADYLQFYINILPETQAKPDIWIFYTDLDAYVGPWGYSEWYLMNRRIELSEWFSPYNPRYTLDSGYTGPDSYWAEESPDAWADETMYLQQVYDVEEVSSIDYYFDSSEFEILPDGSIHVTDHYHIDTLGGTVDWAHEWWFSGNSWCVKFEDTFTNTGDGTAKFALEWYTYIYAEDYTQWIIPGRYDDWAYITNPDYIMKSELEPDKPVIYARDAGSPYSSFTPGAYGAIVFPELPEAIGLDWASHTPPDGTTYYADYYDTLYYWWTFTLGPGESYEWGEWYHVYTGSNPDAEEQLSDTIDSLLKPAPEAAPRAVGGEVFPVDKLALLAPYMAAILVVAATGAAVIKKRIY